MFVRQVIACLEHSVRGAQHEPIAHLRHFCNGAAEVLAYDGAELARQMRFHRETDAHRRRLAGRVQQHRGRPRARILPMAEGEVYVDGLEPQDGPRRLGAVHPQQPKMSPAAGMVRVGWVGHQDDLVSRIAEERQQALALEVKAVGRAADLSRPPKAKLTRRVLMHRQRTVSGGRRLAPLGDLRRAQAGELGSSHRVGVPPLGVRTVQRHLEQRAHRRIDELGWYGRAVEGRMHATNALVEGAHRKQELRMQCRRDAFEGGVGGERGVTDLLAKCADEQHLRLLPRFGGRKRGERRDKRLHREFRLVLPHPRGGLAE